MNIEDLLGEAQLPETVVTLCLAGNLAAEHERLVRIVTEPTSLAGPLDDNAQRLLAVREQMHAQEREFALRALPPLEFRKHRKNTPIPASLDEARTDSFIERYHAWTCELVAATVVDPVMTAEQAGRLAERLSDGQWTKLADAAWSVNTETLDVPFSAGGSAPPPSFEPQSPPPEPSVPASAGSLAGPASNAPSSSGTRPATSLAG